MKTKFVNFELQKQKKEALKERMINDLRMTILAFESKVQEQEKLIQQINEEKIQTLTKNEIMIKENQEIKNLLAEKEINLEISRNRIKELEHFENICRENATQFEILKKNKEGNQILNFTNYTTYPQLATKMVDTIIELNSKIKILESKYVEGKKIDENSFYSGPVNEEKLPQGVGTLIIKNPYRKFIGEFDNGKIMNDLGFMIDKDKKYYFGKIIKGRCKNYTLIIQFARKGQKQICYFGQTKSNQYNGKGKAIFAQDIYYDGEWVNGKAEGKGKKSFSNDSYYDGGWKNNKYEGQGIYYLFKSGKVDEIQDGFWLNGKRQGKFIITDFNNLAFF